MLKKGLMQMRSKPRSCCAYIAPIDVPTMSAGCSRATSCFSIGSASAGSTGMSGARTTTLSVLRRSQYACRSSATVPLAPEEAKPWR